MPYLPCSTSGRFKPVNTRSAKRVVYCILWLFFSALVHTGSAQPLPLDTYTPANGMVDNRVSKMFQDSHGRLFFLTREGFSVFDGQRFENFLQAGGIPMEICNGASENEDGSVNVYSFSGIIFRYLHGKVTADTTHKNLLTEFTHITPYRNGWFLISTNYRLVLKKGNTLQPLTVKLNEPGYLYVEQMALAGNNLVFNRWTDGGQRRLVLYNIETQQVTDIYVTPQNSIIVQGPNGTAYFGMSETWQQFDSLALLQGKLVPRPVWFAKLLPPAFRNTLLRFDKEGNPWFIHARLGSCRIDRVTGEKKYCLVKDGLLQGQGEFFQDREKNYWFIATDKGVQKLQQTQLTEVGELGGRPLGSLYGLQYTRQNQLVAHQYVAGVMVQPGKTYPPQNDFLVFWQNEPWYLKDNGDLVGGSGRRIRLQSGQTPYSKADWQLAGKHSEDSAGRLLLIGSYLVVIDKQYHATAIKLPYFADNVVIDEQGDYWCFTRSFDIVQLRWQNDSLRVVANYVLPGINPRFTIPWRPGVFAVGSRHNGIWFLTREKDRLRITGVLNRENGLSNNFVNCIVKRGDNELLVGTANGLDQVRILPNDTLVKRVAAGSNLFTGFSILVRTAEDIIYGRSDDGILYRLENREAQPEGYLPRLQFRNLLVNGEEKDMGRENRFAYTRNNFRFSVSCPSFLDNKNIYFHFVLQGNGRTWQQNSQRADYEINNLAPGRYTLVVTVNHPGRIYPDESIQYQFTITPPLWKRWWFIALVAAAVTLGIWQLIGTYLRRKLQKQRAAFEQQQAIERERTRIATDMHDDFGAGLSRIKFISEKLLLQHRGEETLKPQLEKISGYSDEMAEKMGEIVWALNQKYDTLGDLVAFCRAYASEYLHAQNITPEFSAQVTERRLMGEIRRNLFLVLKEALHNIAKHAGATKAKIAFRLHNNLLFMEIADNGRGLNPEQVRPFANGIENMKKRIADCGGTIHFENAPGLKISISVPLNF